MKKHAILLLWMGAAISISEIYTGGLMTPLGYRWGLGAILLGHLIGTGLLAFGSYISFSRRENAMGSLVRTLGRGGAGIIALLNVVQLIGWTIVMVVQAGNAAAGIFPQGSFKVIVFLLSVLVTLWALILGSPAEKLNEAVVILLALFCVLLFAEALGAGTAGTAGGPPPVSGGMSFTLGVELSIAMPVSWLPLAGDYGFRAEGKTGAAVMPFIGYFTGSVLMYGFGLFIGLSSGKDIFAFMVGSRFKIIACAVVLFSTLTTAFLDLYSAALSSRRLIKTRNGRIPILVIGALTALVSLLFPVEKYDALLTGFLGTIGMVFVPVYTVLFLDYLFKGKEAAGAFEGGFLVIIAVGMAAYRFFSRYEIWIPTILTMAAAALCFMLYRLYRRRRGNAGAGPS
jgi:putative hydroxymethylpyrimidine transporter CytX